MINELSPFIPSLMGNGYVAIAVLGSRLQAGQEGGFQVPPASEVHGECSRAGLRGAPSSISVITCPH
jgi:hypothetical protein